MADVSVEFGAKDTGLEATLKTVQAEMSRLETEIKSGELSFNDLNTAMRDLAKADKVQNQLQAMAQATREVAEAAKAAEPKLDALGNSANNAGNKAENSAGMFDASFTKIASAFTVGNLAAKGFEAIIDGVFSAGRAIVDGFSQALDLGGRLSELSSRTGETAGKLLVLETAFKNAGLSGDQVGTVINKLQNFMQDAANGGDKQKAAMDNLGISLSELAGKTPTQQMEVFAAKIAAIEDPTARAAAASEVFGEKLGGNLLPLLTQFSPSLTDAEGKVGSLASVMDEHAGTFDTFGESVDAVKEKFVAFAAGILSETIPAFQSLGTEMQNVDAAGLGQKIGSALNAPLKDLNGLVTDAKLLLDGLAFAEQQIAEDTGALGATYNTTQSALASFNNGLFDALAYVTPFDESIESLRETFVGYRKDQDGVIVGIGDLGAAAAEAAPILDTTATAADGVATSLNAIGVDSGDAFDSINESATTFKSLINDGMLSLSDMTGEISSQIPLSTQHAEIMGEINVSLGEANVKAGEQLDTIEKQIVAEQERNNKIAARQADSLAEINTQNQINAALAAGNTTLADSLEAKKKHADLTEKIMKDTGLSKDEAKKLATETINVANAAQQAKNNAGGLTTNLANAKTAATGIKPGLGSIAHMLASIAKEKIEDPIKKFRAQSQEAQTDLKGISTILNVDLAGFGQVDTMKKLGLDPSAIQGSENRLDAIKEAIDILKNADAADLTPTVDQVGVQDNIDAIQTYIKSKFAKATTAAVKATADKNAADNAAGDIRDKVGSVNSQVTTQTDDNNIQSTRATIEKGVAGIPLTFTVDPEAIKKSIGTIDVSGGAGGGVLSSIETLVSTIQGYVETIKDRLPMTALA